MLAARPTPLAAAAGALLVLALAHPPPAAALEPAAVAALTVGPAQGPTQRNLFGLNWEGSAFGWTFRNATSGGLLGWVDAGAPYLSSKLVASLRLLRVRSLRFPGGTPSNYYDWQNASFTPPRRCSPFLPAGGCGTYWQSQENSPRASLSLSTGFNLNVLKDTHEITAVY